MWIIVSVSASSGKTAMQIRQEQSVTLPRPDLQVIRTHSKTYPKRSTQPTGEPHLTHDSHPMRCESCYVCPIFWFYLKPPFIFRTPIKIFFMKSESSLTLRGFWMTWGWVINDRIFIFGWTNPLTLGTVNLSKTHKYLNTYQTICKKIKQKWPCNENSYSHLCCNITVRSNIIAQHRLSVSIFLKILRQIVPCL